MPYDHLIYIVPISWHSIWKLHTPAKIRNFIWRVTRNAVSTQPNCVKDTLQILLCAPYISRREGISGALALFCEHAKVSWFASQLCYSPDRIGFQGLNRWWSSLNSSQDYEETSSLAADICWQIWKARYAFLKQGKPPLPIQTALKAQRLASECNSATHTFAVRIPPLASPTSEQTVHRWSKAPPNLVKINCAASFKANDWTGIGVIVRDHNGLILHGRSSARVGEALAITEALALAPSFSSQ